MKKFILNSLFFLVFTLGAMAMLNLWVHTKVKTNDYYSFKYTEIYQSSVNANNAIIGTSHAVHGIQPQILNNSGNTFFNFAYDGANPEFYLHWYKKVFRPNYKKPEHMIIAVDWFFFDSKKLYRKYEQDAEYFSGALFLNDLVANKDLNKTSLVKNRFPILKYGKTLIKELFGHDKYTFPVDKYKDGYIPYQSKNPKIEEFYPTKINIDTLQKRCFEELIALVQNDGIKIIFVVTPTYHLNNRIFEDFHVYSYYEKISGKYKIPMINYNTKKRSYINSNKAYYCDGGHLNDLGSAEFSRLLKSDLAEIMQ